MKLALPRVGAAWLWILGCVISSQMAAPVLAESAADEKPPTTYRLSPSRPIGKLACVTAELEVGGELRFPSGTEIVSAPLRVEAKLKYDEKLLSAEEQPPRTLRHYETAEATIQVDEAAAESRLRDDRRLVGAKLAGEQVVLASPAGPLTRDELDLLDVLGSTLVLDQLLPTEPVALGGRWKQDAAVVQALLGLDAVSHCEVESLLANVDAEVAEVMVAGVVHGAAEGVSTEIQLKARYHFHLQRRQIVGVTLAVNEQRAIGHVGPGLDVVAKLRLKIVPLAASDALSEAAVKEVADRWQPDWEQLEHRSLPGGYRLVCDRRWYVTSDERDLLVLRRVERGNLIAQCNVSPVAPRSAEKPISLAEYQHEVRRTLGTRFGRVISAGEWTDSAGQLVYRVTAQGKVEELPIEWRYYLIHHPDGRRVALAFTVEAELASRFADADRALVDALRLEPAEETASKAASGTTR